MRRKNKLDFGCNAKAIHVVYFWKHADLPSELMTYLMGSGVDHTTGFSLLHVFWFQVMTVKGRLSENLPNESPSLILLIRSSYILRWRTLCWRLEEPLRLLCTSVHLCLKKLLRIREGILKWQRFRFKWVF